MDLEITVGYKLEDLRETGYIYVPYMEFKPEGGFDYYEIDTLIEPSTWLPTPEHPRTLYYKAHKKCPKCGSKHTCQTLAGYTFDMQYPELFKDENRAECKCGWIGIVHDLT